MILWRCRRFDRELSTPKNPGFCHLGIARTRSKFMLNFWNPQNEWIASPLKPIFVKLTTRLVPSITHHFLKCLVYPRNIGWNSSNFGNNIGEDFFFQKYLTEFFDNINKNCCQTWKLWVIARVECTLTENCRRYTSGCTVPKILIIIPGSKLLNIIAK